MAEVFFYHLTERPLEAVLVPLLVRSLERDWRVLLRGADRARLEWLDEHLWVATGETFLPHGLAGGPHDHLQPVLLTPEPEGRPNRAEVLISIDGARLAPGELAACTRGMVLFDGNDPAAVEHARGQWKAFAEAGLSCVYWAEEAGRWQRKAESGQRG